MAVPTLTPASQTSAVRLPVTGTHANVNTTTNPLPFGIYTGPAGSQESTDFVSGAVDQVAFVYKKLGGDVLDIELTQYQVYAAYEEAVLEYSYLINIHQAKNILSDVLGATTGTFDHDGEMKAGALSSSLSGGHISLKFPRVSFEYSKRVADGTAFDASMGGGQAIYSASIAVSASVQDYDLQSIISSSAVNDTGSLYYNKVGNKKISIRRVFYKSPYVMWRFFGYYGGLSVVGNLQNYGQYSDDSSFELIPTWQNKLQAMAFDDSVYTRISHYSYEIRNNQLRIFPEPSQYSPENLWVEFSIKTDPWEEDDDKENGVDGINNMNTLPFANIPYKNINSIGKQWIRRFGLAICKEMLGQVRGKFQTVPIPGESVTLNHGALIDQGKTEQEKLREELKTVLDEMVYTRLAEIEAAKMEATNKVQQHVPMTIFVG
tara:strand:+ start:426 stop:1724 length:1299 start_codon:yes stop_codon:yes gene_type:complete